MSEERFLAELAELRMIYTSQLPARVAALESACDEALAAPGNCAAASAAGHLAHKLAGSLGTFGLPALGRLAKSLELLLQSLNPATIDQIRPLLSSLREASKSV